MSRRFVSILIGLLLLAWGLGMMGVSVFGRAGNFVAWLVRLWPLFLVAWGAHAIYSGLTGVTKGRGQGLIVGSAVLGLGLALLAQTLAWPWADRIGLFPALVAGAGIGFVLRAIVAP